MDHSSHRVASPPLPPSVSAANTGPRAAGSNLTLFSLHDDSDSADSTDTADAQQTIRSMAFIGTHPPRQCGIASFTSDLVSAMASSLPNVECFVLAINDAGWRDTYPARVRFEVSENDVASYQRAADFLNVNGVDVVALQHEYGIFGGKAGAHVLTLLKALRMPVVTTLHTVLPEPNAQQRAVLDQVVALSQRVVVMGRGSAKLLSEQHGVPAEKIDVIPHGIAPVAPVRRSKTRLGVRGRSVLMTFGLLSPDKGLEYVIDALPAIVERFPEVVYLIVGATHPHVKLHHGEAYRLSLQHRARRLGVEQHVIFHDRFVSTVELAEFISATDIYLTPYLKPEQASSGTLALALGSGKAIVSTRYAYACELLAEGRGVLVPAHDASAIGREVVDLLADDLKRFSFAAKAAAHGSEMTWQNVSKRYDESFARAREEHVRQRRLDSESKTSAAPIELPAMVLDHVRSLTDDTGILQHALFSTPRYDHGYCVDDNARALLLMTLIEDAGTDDIVSVRALASRYLAFVSHAYNEQTSRFRNFMDYRRNWSEASGSEDCQGRAVWALGAVVGRSRDPGKRSLAGTLFKRALHSLPEFTSPRAWALGVLGIAEYLRAFQGDLDVQGRLALMAERLLDLYRRVGSAQWCWFETTVTYENARLSQALIVAGDTCNNPEMTSAGLQTLEWLLQIQSASNGDFEPIGSNGFYPRGGVKAAFDQQPIDVWAMISACLEAYRVSGSEAWMQRANRVFGWFMGQNHLQLPLYDAATGGCRDGLHAERPNENQGAESTLAFQLSLLEMRSLNAQMSVRDARNTQ